MQMVLQFFLRIALSWTGDIDLDLTFTDKDGAEVSAEDDAGGCSPVARTEELVFPGPLRVDTSASVAAKAQRSTDCGFDASLQVFGGGQLIQEISCDTADCTGIDMDGDLFSLYTYDATYPCSYIFDGGCDFCPED